MPEELSITEALSQILAAVSGDQYLPDPDYLTYYQLLKNRIVYLDTYVDVSLLLLHKQILLWNTEDEGVALEDRKPIRIVIMSYGGNLDYMWMMIDTVRMSITPVYTYNIGTAHSAASLIFMAGSKRFMTPNARLMIHEGSAGFEGDAQKMIDMSEAYKKVLKRMKDFILERTEVPKTTLNKKRSNDWELNAEECLNYKICTHIVDSISDIIG